MSAENVPDRDDRISRRRFLIFLGMLLAAIIAGLSFLRKLGIGTINRFRIRSIEPIPPFDPATWALTVDGLVDKPLTISYEQLLALPGEAQISDFHCVEGWSVDDVNYRGVRLKTLFDMAGLKQNAKFATFHSASSQYRDSLSVKEAQEADVMLAYQIYGRPLAPEQGRPLRLVMPRMFGYKNVKWVNRITLTETQEIGYWVQRGYNIDGVSY